jgi:putative membrane protein
LQRSDRIERSEDIAMKRSIVYVTCLAVSVFLPSFALAQQSGKPVKERKAAGEERFVTNAAHDNLAEVQLGKLAAERGTSDEVKKFGERMVTDHRKADDELKQLASTKGLSVPSEPDSRAKKEYDRLAKMSGAEFDRAYMDLMVKEHERDVKAFERAASKEKEAQLRDWAAKTLPTLKEHLTLAKETNSHVRTAGKERGMSPSASPGTTKSSR